ncbi:MAG: endolytic transglycosylase MltG [Acidobacteria bacterium]|nr:endolytic transglycosylase MltG [Acidobacteriota bacterium]TDI56663.1 MAG: endolytic transglycosylase MltG [Acidobacteriota bacterium]
MTFEPVPEEPFWARILKIALAAAMVVLTAVLVIGGASYLGRQVGAALGPEDETDAPVDVEPGQPVEIVIASGSSGQDIGAMLAVQGVVHSALEFEVAVRNVDAAQRLQAGTYALTTLMDPAEVVAILVAGPTPAVYRVTVIEGLRVEEMLVALAEITPHEYSELEDALLGGDVVSSLREMPEQTTLSDWEGLLFPDTYEFAKSAPPESILQRMASKMEQRVNSIDWSDWRALGYTEYEGIVLASLIEAEVRVDDERAVVSSVIHNRLAEGMKLDIDATVYYALGTRDVTRFDRTVDSPYNTYVVVGLPPTPIALPGKASLVAAASPEATEYFFYVLADRDGNHVFAKTFDEHLDNVNRARDVGVPP